MVLDGRKLPRSRTGEEESLGRHDDAISRLFSASYVERMMETSDKYWPIGAVYDGVFTRDAAYSFRSRNTQHHLEQLLTHSFDDQPAKR